MRVSTSAGLASGYIQSLIRDTLSLSDSAVQACRFDGPESTAVPNRTAAVDAISSLAARIKNRCGYSRLGFVVPAEEQTPLTVTPVFAQANPTGH